jgi:hypothetical protein
MVAIPSVHARQEARQRGGLKCLAVPELRVAQSSPLVMQSVQAICRVRLIFPDDNHVVFSSLQDLGEPGNGL